MKRTTIVVSTVIALAILGNNHTFGQFTWLKEASNPVLAGASGTWNKHVFAPSVLYNPDSARYEMWFGAAGNASVPPARYGFAVSKNGVDWTMYPTAVLSPSPGTWDAVNLDAMTVVRENGVYKMWYNSYPTLDVYPCYVGYATSPDGTHWTKYSGNPILGPGTAAWEVGGVFGCCVMPVPGGYRMWYSGIDSAWKAKIGYAVSVDGINWVRDTVHNPVFDAGAPNDWDAGWVIGPRVLHIKDVYYMWYASRPGGSREWVTSTGMAISNDGVTDWKRYSGNPVIGPTPGAWDQDGVYVTSVLLHGDTLHLWYDGYKSPIETNLWRIGHATSALITDVIAERVGNGPRTFMLEQNYPNPFNAGSVIGYRVQGLGVRRVRLAVYDLLGREVAVLVDERKEPGRYQVEFDGAKLSSGVYIYRLIAGDIVESKRMILLK